MAKKKKKNENRRTKIRKKTRIFALTTRIQHFTGASRQGHN